MLGKRQFSLTFVFIEVSLIAAALGAARLVYDLNGLEDAYVAVIVPLAFSVPLFVCAAIGGLFGHFGNGALFGIGIDMLLYLLLPAVE